MTTQRLRVELDLNLGEQEVLQRILAEPNKIAHALAPNDPREAARIVDVISELAAACAQSLFEGTKEVITRQE
ncbi:hypothetical protein D9M68_550490 [compost metagenome]